MSLSAASSPRPRYAIVGLGGRAQMFVDALTGAHADTAQLVAFCDTNQTRMDVHNRTVVGRGLPAVPTYQAADFGRMLDAERGDTVVVTCVQRNHPGAHADTAQLVAFCDTNQTRMDVHNRTVVGRGLPAVPTYQAADFGRMLDAERVDTVIVTSIDRTHDEYIVAALRAGRDVITEK